MRSGSGKSGRHFLRILRDKAVSRFFCTSTTVLSLSTSLAPKDTRQSQKGGLKYLAYDLRGKKICSWNEASFRKRKHICACLKQSHCECILSYHLCPAGQEQELPRRAPSGGSTSEPHPSALPSFASGQVYSYHLPINAKWWIEVLQDLHYTKSFLGNQRHT